MRVRTALVCACAAGVGANVDAQKKKYFWQRTASVAAVASHRDQLFEAIRNLDAKSAAALCPVVYAEWWRALLHDSPEHVAVETLLVAFLLWVLVRGSRRPKDDGQPKLKKQEIDELVADWQPEPLVPPKCRAETLLIARSAVVSSYADGFVTFASGAPGLKADTLESVGDLILGGGPARLLNCASFDFLAMGGSEEVRLASRDALRHYGCGSCGPRGFYGTIDVHESLEQRVAAFCGVERAIAFSDSASCTSSTIAAFAKRGDLVIFDEAISEPLRTGVLLSRASALSYKHCDMVDLESVLASVVEDDRVKGRAPGTQRRFVVTEAISQDTGRVAPLLELLRLKDLYGCRLCLDESLSFGVIGATGRGLKEHCGVSDPDVVEITTMDLAPSFGSLGGLCVGTSEVIDHQRLSGAGYCFSAAAPPFVSAAALASLNFLETSPGRDRLAQLQKNATLLRSALRSRVAPAADSLLALVGEEDGSADDLAPFAVLALARPTGDAELDLLALSRVVDAVATAGFALALAKHDQSFYGDRKKASALPPAREKQPLSLKLATNARHTQEQILLLVDAIANAAAVGGTTRE